MVGRKSSLFRGKEMQRKRDMSKQLMRDETERLVKEALERKTVTVKQCRTRIEAKCENAERQIASQQIQGRSGCYTGVRNVASNKRPCDTRPDRRDRRSLLRAEAATRLMKFRRQLCFSSSGGLVPSVGSSASARWALRSAVFSSFSSGTGAWLLSCSFLHTSP